MNKRQINYKERFDSLLHFLDANAVKWSSIPKIVEFKNALSSVNDKITDAHKAQSEAQVWVGKNKKLLKKTIAEKGDVINDLLEAFASVSGNASLEYKMAASASDLLNLRNEVFIVHIKEIITEAENHSDILISEYGMTTELVDDLKKDLDKFLSLKGLPRAFKIASSQASNDLEILFKEANTILYKKLNKVMKVFKHRDANFYNGYRAACTIIDD